MNPVCSMEQGCCAVIVSSVLPVGARCCCLKPGCCRHQQPVYCQKEPNAARKDTRLLEGTCFLLEWILYVAQWSQDAVVKPVYCQMLEPVCCPLEPGCYRVEPVNCQNGEDAARRSLFYLKGAVAARRSQF